MKQYFATFITKPLKCKFCPTFAAVNEKLEDFAYIRRF